MLEVVFFFLFIRIKNIKNIYFQELLILNSIRNADKLGCVEHNRFACGVMFINPG